jgi:hypothetical protein
MGRQKKDENHSPPQNKLVQDSEGNEENKYTDSDSNKKDKLCQRTLRSPQEHPERRNPERNHREFHGVVTRHAQSKHTRGTKEIPKRQK